MSSAKIFALSGMDKESMKQLEVLSVYTEGGQAYVDVNHNARANPGDGRTVIDVSAQAPNGSDVSLSGFRNQNTVEYSHAEIGGMYKALTDDKRTPGASPTGDLYVFGLPVCPTCRNTNIGLMANELGINTLNVHEYVTGGEYQLSGNDFFAASRGGSTWKSCRVN